MLLLPIQIEAAISESSDMYKFRRIEALILAAMLTLAPGGSLTLADQGCPEGLAPIGQAPGPICVPQPGYMGPPAAAVAPVPQGAPMPQIQMAPYVKKKAYGIHVTDKDRSQLYSTNFRYAPHEASRIALAFCEQKTGRKCVSLGTFVDQCQAIVIDRNRQTYRGVDVEPQVAAREALTNCGAADAGKQCRLWRLPLCSGYSMGYVDGPYVGEDQGRTPEQIKAEIDTMTKTISAELRGTRPPKQERPSRD